MPSFMDTPVIGKRLRDVIMLEYVAHAFDDCWKLSLNILYFVLKAVSNFILSVMSMII